MGGIRAELDIGRKKAWALFDTGSRNSYVVPRVAKGLPTISLPTAFHVALGGKRHDLKRRTLVSARLQGRVVDFDAFVLDSIGRDEDGREIDILYGALDMQRWGIRPVPDQEKLDMSHYSKEFVEFLVPRH